MALRRTLLLLLFAFAQASAALAAPQNGWWWNPAENGRGFFIEISDNLVYVGAYVYAANGRADWVVSQGTLSTPTSYSGRLLSFRGGQTLVGDYRAPGPATDVGAISIQFTDDRHATLTWPGGTTPIERLTFGASTPIPLPKTGWWWNPDESGTGYSIEVQGSTLFLVGFMYDDAGNPVWYYSAGPMSGEGSYHGDVLQFANGQPVGGSYRAPDAPVVVGRVDIEFEANDEATMTLSDNALAKGGVAQKRRRSQPVRPTLPPPRLVLPVYWQGGTTTSQHLDQNSFGFRDDWFYKLTVDVGWNDPLPQLTQQSGLGRWYPSGTVPFEYSITSASPVDSCSGTGTWNVPLSRSNGTLEVESSGSYSLNFNVTIPVQVTLDCVDQQGARRQRQMSFTPYQVNIARSGTVVQRRIAGSRPFNVPLPDGTLSGVVSFAFTAVP